MIDLVEVLDFVLEFDAMESEDWLYLFAYGLSLALMIAAAVHRR
jgi:hypothetical protein